MFNLRINLKWLRVPVGLMTVLLQRTPALRVAADAAEFVLQSRAAFLLKSSVAAAASLGAVHSLAGATTLVVSQPSPLNVTVGQSVAVAFAITGAPSSPASWVISGAVAPGLSFSGATSGVVNSSTLSLTGTPTTPGTYLAQVVAWEGRNGTGNKSPTYSYTVNVTGTAVAPPAITTQPQSQTVNAGANVTFTVAATGDAPLSYQWTKNGAAISGATGASLSLTAVAAADAGTYAVTVTNSAGSATSSNATLTVNTPATAPTITAQPTNQTVNAGANVTFSVTASGTAPLSYQWTKNGTAISGATSASLTLSAVSTGDAGSYAVTVSNSAGAVTSNSVTLTVNTPATAPAITTQPQSQTVEVGANVSFTVAASGTAPLTYQWTKNGTALSGATSATLALSAVATGDAGTYAAIVTNAAGSATSNGATLTVNTPVPGAPTIATQPQSQSVNTGANVTFSVVAAGTGPFTYQWSKNSAAISGATSASLTLNAVATTDAGSYTVTVSNSGGSVTSAPATLTVNAPATAPTIATQPQNQTVTAGANATFTVVANGTAPLTYQWTKNGTAISGATSATLTLNATTATDAGTYAVTVTNSVGSVTSSGAMLTVNAPTAGAPTITTQPQSQTVNAGVNVTFTVAASGTAPLSYQWTKNGTAISGATSATLTLTAVAAADAGTYAATVSNIAGSVTSSAATLTVNAPGNTDAPKIAIQPQGATLASGSMLALAIEATGAAPLRYQWSKDGTALSGATKAQLIVSSVSSTSAGRYTVTVTNAAGSVTSDAAVIAVIASPASRLANLSVRTNLGRDEVLTVGFATSGERSILVRGVGPALEALGVTGAFPDPKIEIYNASGARVNSNDNWSASIAPVFARVGAFPLPVGSKDAALVTTLSGPYTAQFKGTGSGVGLVEVYDAGSTSRARLINVSARSVTGSGGHALTTGFVIDGPVAKTVLIRGIGAALAAFGVPSTLSDPKLSLFGRSGATIADNDDWNSDLATIFNRTGAFPLQSDSKDAALLITLPPGLYTAQISGAAGTGGNVLIEVYDVDAALNRSSDSDDGDDHTDDDSRSDG